MAYIYQFEREMKEQAYSIAIDAHRDQLDKGGARYLNHVLRVANTAVADLEFGCGDHTACYCIGLLHDVLEDSNVLTLSELYRLFPSDIADAVIAITHTHGEPYVDYLKRVKANRLATIVKIADIRDNLDVDRAIAVRHYGSAKQYERLMRVLWPRYVAALDYLIGGEERSYNAPNSTS